MAPAFGFRQAQVEQVRVLQLADLVHVGGIAHPVLDVGGDGSNQADRGVRRLQHQQLRPFRMPLPQRQQPLRTLHPAGAGQVQEGRLPRDFRLQAVGTAEADVQGAAAACGEQFGGVTGLAQDRVVAGQVALAARRQPLRIRHQQVQPGQPEPVRAHMLQRDVDVVWRGAQVSATQTLPPHAHMQQQGLAATVVPVGTEPGHVNLVAKRDQRRREQPDIVTETALVVPRKQIDTGHGESTSAGRSVAQQTADAEGQAQHEEQVERLRHRPIKHIVAERT